MFHIPALLVTLSAISPSALFYSEKIEARVGTRIITSSEVENLTTAISQTTKDEPRDRVRRRALDTLIDRNLISIYLQQIGAGIPDREVEQRINAIKAQNGVTSQDEFKALLSRQGLSFEEFREQVRSQMEYGQFLNFVRRDASQTIEDKELMAHFKNNAKEFASTYEVELQECALPFGNEPQKTEKLVLEYKNNPKNFDECVSKHSQSPSTSEKGMLGKFKLGMLREDIERLVFDAEKGEVVVIRQPISFQLLKIINRIDLGPASFESVKERLKIKLQEERLQKEIQRKLSELRSTTYIQI